MDVPEFIYKIADAAAFAQAEGGVFAGAPIDARDGFIHFSTARQLPETLRLYFAGQGGLLLVAVRSGDLGAALRWEPSRGGDLFPHLYAALSLSSVAWTAPIAVDAEGRCVLPQAAR